MSGRELLASDKAIGAKSDVSADTPLEAWVIAGSDGVSDGTLLHGRLSMSEVVLLFGANNENSGANIQGHLVGAKVTLETLSSFLVLV